MVEYDHQRHHELLGGDALTQWCSPAKRAVLFRLVTSSETCPLIGVLPTPPSGGTGYSNNGRLTLGFLTVRRRDVKATGVLPTRSS